MDTLTVILIVIDAIIIIAYLIHLYSQHKKNSKKHHDWPPPGYPQPCPDYWTLGKDGLCHNNFRLGTDQSGKSTTHGDSTLDVSSINEACIDPKHRNNKSCLKYKNEWSHATRNSWFGTAPGCSAEGSGQCY